MILLSVQVLPDDCSLVCSSQQSQSSFDWWPSWRSDEQHFLDIENYPGYANISGPELAEKMFEPRENLGAESLWL